MRVALASAALTVALVLAGPAGGAAAARCAGARTRSPNVGRGDNSLQAVAAASACDAWAVGSYLNPKRSFARTLIEHWDGKRWSIDCPFPRAFDEETKTWGEEITWDEVLARWKRRGPMNEAYVEKLQRGYRTTSSRRAG